LFFSEIKVKDFTTGAAVVSLSTLEEHEANVPLFLAITADDGDSLAEMPKFYDFDSLLARN